MTPASPLMQGTRQTRMTPLHIWSSAAASGDMTQLISHRATLAALRGTATHDERAFHVEHTAPTECPLRLDQDPGQDTHRAAVAIPQSLLLVNSLLPHLTRDGHGFANPISHTIRIVRTTGRGRVNRQRGSTDDQTPTARSTAH